MWEYLILEIEINNEVFNIFGKQGWELVTILKEENKYTSIFKRKKEKYG